MEIVKQNGGGGEGMKLFFLFFNRQNNRVFMFKRQLHIILLSLSIVLIIRPRIAENLLWMKLDLL